MRYYLICIGFLHLLLLITALTMIVISSVLIQDSEREYLIYKMMFCKELVIIFLCAGVLNLLVIVLSAVSSALTFPSKELRALYRVVALVTVVAILLDLVFLIRSAHCKLTENDVTKRFNKIFENYGKYDELYEVQESDSCGHQSPSGRGLKLSNETEFFDYIQFNYKCCGVWGKFDYARINQPIPVTCCGIAERSNETIELGHKMCPNTIKHRAALHIKKDARKSPDLGVNTNNLANKDDLPNKREGGNGNGGPGPGAGGPQEPPPVPETPANDDSVKLAEHPLECDGCVVALYDTYSDRNMIMWILVWIKIILDVYVATSSCFILIAEAPPGKYPT